MAHGHFAVAVRALAVAAPQVNGNVRAAGGLEPNARTAKPPHSDVARLHNLVFDVLNQPRAPLREGGHNPLVPRHFRNFAHASSSSPRIRKASGELCDICQGYHSRQVPEFQAFFYVRFSFYVCFAFGEGRICEKCPELFRGLSERKRRFFENPLPVKQGFPNKNLCVVSK